MRISDWSSDVCSSDLRTVVLAVAQRFGGEFGCGLIGHGIGLSLESDRKPLRCQAPVSGGTGGCGALSSGGRAAQWAAGKVARRTLDVGRTLTCRDAAAMGI